MTKHNKTNAVSSQVDSANKIAALRAALVAAQDEAKQIETQQNDEMRAQINALPAQFGLETMDQFTAMVRKFTRVSTGKRVVLTPENRIEVTNMLIAGTSAKEVAIKFGVSAGTVNLIKKEAGLTKARAQVVVDTSVTQ